MTTSTGFALAATACFAWGLRGLRKKEGKTESFKVLTLFVIVDLVRLWSSL